MVAQCEYEKSLDDAYAKAHNKRTSKGVYMEPETLPGADVELFSIADAMKVTKMTRTRVQNLVPFAKGFCEKATFDAWWQAHCDAKTAPPKSSAMLQNIGNKDWQSMYLDFGPHGGLKPTAANVRIILKNDEEWRNVFTFNAFSGTTNVCKAIPSPTCGHNHGQTYDADGNVIPQPLSDADVWMVKVWMEDSQYKISLPERQVRAVIEAEARQTAFHPVRDYLNGAFDAWDRKARLDTWLIDYLGVDDTPYARMVGRFWLISAVARVMEPGVQVDHVLILEGDQGIGKSTACRIMATQPAWYTDSDLDLHNKETAMLLRGKWVVEFSELGGMRKGDRERIKGFFTTHSDKIIQKYENYETTFHRQCVFVATVNLHEYLVDDTGNRRFWPVRCTSVKSQELKNDMIHLWGEAKSAYSSFIVCPECQKLGERCGWHRWYPTADEQMTIISSQQDMRKTQDPWTDDVRRWIKNRTEMGHTPTTGDVLAGIGRPAIAQTDTDAKRMRTVIKNLGAYESITTYIPRADGKSGIRTSVWRPK